MCKMLKALKLLYAKTVIELFSEIIIDDVYLEGKIKKINITFCLNS